MAENTPRNGGTGGGQEPEHQPLDYANAASSVGRGIVRVIGIILMVIGGIVLLLLGICAVAAIKSR
jgi:hypothetical protein